MTYTFIRSEKAKHSCSKMCRALGVSRSGYSQWEKTTTWARKLSDAELLKRIREIFLI